MKPAATFMANRESPIVEVPLSRGLVATIDRADQDKVCMFRWHATTGRLVYAATNFRAAGRQRLLYLHRYILGARTGQAVDHVNGNSLDNRRCNLRLATPAQNVANMRPRKGSALRGVTWHRLARKWVARIGREPKYLGVFECKIDAIRAYNHAARVRFGSFARLNPEVA